MLQGNAADLPVEGGVEKVGDQRGGGFVGEALGPDVGDAVAFGVGSAGTRMEGEISAEGIGRSQPRAFADEDQAEHGGQLCADLVRNGDAALENNVSRGERPAGEFRKEGGKERSGVLVDGCGAETIGDDESEVAVLWLEDGGGKEAAEVGSGEVGGPVWSLGTKHGVGVGKTRGIESGPDGVLGAGMVEIKAEAGLGAGALSDAGGSVAG
jgi:hypothetical protein